MEWRRLDFPTRAGVVALVIAVLGVVIPPISVTGALVAAAFSGTAVWRAHRRGEANLVARLCMVGSIGLIVLVVIGSAIYALAD